MLLNKLFSLGMKRDIPALLDAPVGVALNLGAGESKIPFTKSLDFPDWDAESYCIPYNDESVACVHAYHFLEHLYNPAKMLEEIQRILMVGGILNIVVPHASGTMAFQDLDHKKFFVLDTWKNLQQTEYYKKGKCLSRMRLHVNVMMAITERNSAIITQMVKI